VAYFFGPPCRVQLYRLAAVDWLLLRWQCMYIVFDVDRGELWRAGSSEVSVLDKVDDRRRQHRKWCWRHWRFSRHVLRGARRWDGALQVSRTSYKPNLCPSVVAHHGLYGSTSCCISHGPCQWERAIFDPPQLRDAWTDFHEPWNI